jgi:hypothetical protein
MTELAEGQNDTGLSFLHDEKSANQPEKEHHQRDDACTDTCASRVARRAATIAATTTATTIEKFVQALIEVAPQLI